MRWGGGGKGRGLVGFGGEGMRKKLLWRGACQKKKGKKGGHVRYFSKTLKWHNILIFQKCYRTNIEGRIQIYYKLSFCFKNNVDDNNYL